MSNFEIDRKEMVCTVYGDVIKVKSGYIIFDLEKVEKIDGLKMMFESTKIPLNRMIFFYSDDFFDWKEANYTKKYVSRRLDIAFKDLLARYLKLVIQKGHLKKKVVYIKDFDIGIEKIIENKIKDIRIERVGNDFVEIYWETEYPCNCRINYGFDETLKFVQFGTGKGKEHSTVMNNLKSGRKYYFKISNDLDESKISSFYTKGMAEFEISSFNIENTGKNWVSISVGANRRVKAQFQYGLKRDSLDGKILNNNYSGKHKIFVDGLIPDSIYYYELRLKYSDNITRVKEGSFRTLKENVALFKEVEGTFGEYFKGINNRIDKSIIARLVDGDYSWYTGMSTSGDILKKDQYFIIDLGRAYSLKNMVINWQKLAYSKDYSISVSKDRVNWKMASANRSPEAKSLHYISGTPMLKDDISLKVEGRYIKVNCESGNNKYYVKHKDWHFVQVVEVEVYPEHRSIN